MFTFKHFTIHQDRCAMKVGTDGVLLGAWAEAREGRVLDVGTGTGLIALMIAQRTNNSMIHAVEIEPEAARQASENVSETPWKNRVEVICKDIREFVAEAKYDEILSNPPFYSNSPSASTTERNQARKAEKGFFQELVTFVEKALSEHGVFEVVLPSEMADDFIFLCWEHNLFLKRQTKVFTKQGKPCKRMLLAFSPANVNAMKDELVMTDEHGALTSQYKLLTQDFYLK